MATPEVGSSRRNSIFRRGSPENRQTILPHCRRASAGGDSRRNSTGRPSSRNSGEDIVPHYLRASTGSCHDFCKYGREHAHELKSRSPIPKRKAASSSNEEKSIRTVFPVERKKTTVVKLKPSPDPKIHAPEPPEIMKQEILLPSKKVEVSSKRDLSSSRKITENELKIPTKHSPPTKLKSVMGKPSSSSDASVGDSSSSLKITENELKMFTKHSPSAKLKPVMVKPSSSIDASVGFNGRRTSDINIKKGMEIPKAAVKKVFATPTASLSPKPSVSRNSDINVKKGVGFPKAAVKKVFATPTTSLSPKPSVSRNSDINIKKGAQFPKAAVKLVFAIPTASLSPKPSVGRVVSLNARKGRNLKLAFPLKDRNRIAKTKPQQPEDEKVLEKTLHVVQTETGNKVSESDPTDGIILSPQSPSIVLPKSSAHKNSQSSSSGEEEDLDESEYANSEEDDFISENDEIVNSNGLETSNGNQNWTPRKGRVIISEDKDVSVIKLKFRRGKVVDLQSENNGPRRLQFRRGRVLGDNEDSQNGARRRIFKKKGVDNKTKDSSLSSESVVLKHQDVQGKKDAKGLLNNVIEETASKLVESRKSKVMALVGAFETVFSLHDSKPSTPTVT